MKKKSHVAIHQLHKTLQNYSRYLEKCLHIKYLKIPQLSKTLTHGQVTLHQIRKAL